MMTNINIDQYGKIYRDYIFCHIIHPYFQLLLRLIALCYNKVSNELQVILTTRNHFLKLQKKKIKRLKSVKTTTTYY